MSETDLPETDEVTLALPRAAALVAFDFIARLVDEQDPEAQSALFDDPAEPAALWTLVAAFEQVLNEPFAEDYRAVLDEARRKVLQTLTDGS
ncbi:hypothetical protein [Xanthobacter sp. KR7-225]|uniref:hypothetical protein n=1 Tax=Xanthobacter sp. KR7-225 TaxID=3156613 RepID=UPI0032B45F97